MPPARARASAAWCASSPESGRRSGDVRRWWRWRLVARGWAETEREGGERGAGEVKRGGRKALGQEDASPSRTTGCVPCEWNSGALGCLSSWPCRATDAATRKREGGGGRGEGGKRICGRRGRCRGQVPGNPSGAARELRRGDAPACSPAAGTQGCGDDGGSIKTYGPGHRGEKA